MGILAKLSEYRKIAILFQSIRKNLQQKENKFAFYGDQKARIFQSKEGSGKVCSYL